MELSKDILDGKKPFLSRDVDLAFTYPHDEEKGGRIVQNALQDALMSLARRLSDDDMLFPAHIEIGIIRNGYDYKLVASAFVGTIEVEEK